MKIMWFYSTAVFLKGHQIKTNIIKKDKINKSEPESVLLPSVLAHKTIFLLVNEAA